MKMYAIRHEGEKKRYVEIPTSGGPHAGFDLVSRLNAACVMDKDQAHGFLRRPGTDPRYKLVNLTVTIEKPKKLSAVTAKEYSDQACFNSLKDREKWDLYKEEEGIWRCPGCKSDVGAPYRASPFHRAAVCCSECDTELTVRTGGGQSDPFNFVLCAK